MKKIWYCLWILPVISIVLVMGCSSIQENQTPILENDGYTIPSKTDTSMEYYHEYVGTFSFPNSDSPQSLLNYIEGVAYYEFEKIEEYSGYIRYRYRIVTEPKCPANTLDNHKLIPKEYVECNPEQVTYNKPADKIPDTIRNCPELPAKMNYVVGYYIDNIRVGFIACEDYFWVEIPAFNQKVVKTTGDYFWIWSIAEEETELKWWKISGSETIEKPVVLYDTATNEIWNSWEDNFLKVKP